MQTVPLGKRQNQGASWLKKPDQHNPHPEKRLAARSGASAVHPARGVPEVRADLAGAKADASIFDEKKYASFSSRRLRLSTTKKFGFLHHSWRRRGRVV